MQALSTYESSILMKNNKSKNGNLLGELHEAIQSYLSSTTDSRITLKTHITDVWGQKPPSVLRKKLKNK